jgi:DNA-binding NarL/FixJ family response regulator
VIRVMVADDHELLRAGFAMVLEGQDGIEVVAQAAGGAEAVLLCAAMEVDVVLMDVRMPGMDGLEATRRIAAAGRRARIIILTTFDLDEYALEAVRAGASGFLLKDVPPPELAAAVRIVAGGDAILTPRITQLLMQTLAREQRTSLRTGPRPDLSALTGREREVLTIVARGLSNAEIAAVLQLSEATVKTHVSRILTKLGLRDRAQAVVVAYESGVMASEGGTARRPSPGRLP